MNTNIPELGENDAVIPNDSIQINGKLQPPQNGLTNPSFCFKRMNSALFKILSDLKESKSRESSECSEKGSENDVMLAKDAQHLRLDRCLNNEGIFRKGSDRLKSTEMMCYQTFFITAPMNPDKFGCMGRTY